MQVDLVDLVLVEQHGQAQVAVAQVQQVQMYLVVAVIQMLELVVTEVQVFLRGALQHLLEKT
jgi:hypothetical protein